MADPSRRRFGRALTSVVLALLALTLCLLVVGERHAAAGTEPDPIPTPSVPEPDVVTPVFPQAIVPLGGIGSEATAATPSSAIDLSGDDSGADASIDVNFPNVSGDTSNSVVIILLLTVLSIAPSLLVLCTSFTRIVIVLGLTRNALGIPTVPPNQVVVGLSVFLTLFVMGPTLSQMKQDALDPLLAGEISTSQAYDAAQGPLREFLLDHTRDGELKLFLEASDTPMPVARDEVPLNALVPAFVLSELKSAFIMGFVIFVPFLVIDLVVSAVLMGLGMMMLPPSFVSLPFKLLLFIMLDGWMLVTSMLLTSYR